MGLLVDRSAEQGEDGFAEDEVNGRQHEAAHHAEHDGVADGPVGVLAAAAPQGDADKRAAAVADKHRDAQGHHRQRKDGGVGGVAVRAQVVGVGDEELIDDVIQCAHQQRDDAGNSVPPHELSDTLHPQKLISRVHNITFPYEK